MRHAPIVLMLLIASCKAPPQPVASPALAGAWRNADGATLEFEDTGIMVMQLAGPKQRPQVGAYTFDGSAVTFRFPTGSAPCGDRDGRYALDVRADRFDAVVVQDGCEERRKAIAGSWTRTAAGRVTPES